MKHLLQKTLSRVHFTYEEFNTVLTRVEACLNSCPGTPFLSDSYDLSVFTPGNFLIGESLLSIPNQIRPPSQ